MTTSTKLLLLSCACLTGCATYGSQLLDRDSSDTSWEATRTGGIPITVKVPTHVDINIVQRSYYKDGQPFTVATANGQLCSLRTFHVTHLVVETERVFTIDPKRPAAGTAHSTINFDGQYPKDMKSDVTDETILRVGNLISSVNKTFGIGSGRGASDAAPKSLEKLELFPVDRVVAIQRFHLDAADLELQVQQFLDEKLNHCNHASSMAGMNGQ